MTHPTDVYGRQFKTLRVSLTNACNLGCVYCVEETAEVSAEKLPGKNPSQAPLALQKLLETIAALHQILGLEAIRLTGGEPTLYRELLPLMQGVKQLGVPAIKMTTNGYLLSNKITAYAEAGLTSLNISLDALEPEPFFRISRRRNLKKVLEGIEKSVQLGLEVKINCVVMRGVNDDQILPLLNFAKERNIRIRFLELMQMGHLHGNFKDYFFSEAEIIGLISHGHDCQPLQRGLSATAKYWQMPDGYQFGVISNESDPFCNDCNRLRLDSYGNIFGCLSDNTPISIADLVHEPRTIREKLQQALHQKKNRFSGSSLSMLAIGG